MSVVDVLLLLGGLTHLAILAAAVFVPRVLDFRAELAGVSPFMRRLVWVYASFIGLTIAGFGTVTLGNLDALSSGAGLARWFCGLVAVFWAARLAVQVFVFSAEEFGRTRLARVGFHLLTVAFVALVSAYGYAAFA